MYCGKLCVFQIEIGIENGPNGVRSKNMEATEHSLILIKLRSEDLRTCTHTDQKILLKFFSYIQM